MKDTALGEPRHYGEHPREWLQSLHPYGTHRPRADRHILYVHGGGFVAANCIVLMPSVTPWVRAGYTVWCMNYPLSPNAVFPIAVNSVLRCLKWLKSELNIQEVVLTGDSAGGSLATMAAAAVENHSLLERMNIDDEYDEKSFPKLLGVVSIYGLLDRTSFFENETEAISTFETYLSRFALSFLFFAYTNDDSFHEELPRPGKVFAGRCTLCDVVDLLDKYPKTLLIVGTRDVLVHSSRKANKLLSARGFECQLLEYDARHAFCGLPPALNMSGTWRFHSKPATEKVIEFFDSVSWKDAALQTDVNNKVLLQDGS